jgi:hypothetical protein
MATNPYKDLLVVQHPTQEGWYVCGKGYRTGDFAYCQGIDRAWAMQSKAANYMATACGGVAIPIEQIKGQGIGPDGQWEDALAGQDSPPPE